MTPPFRTFCLVSTFVISILTMDSHAKAQGDWPQWRGPLRDGHAADQPLLKSWPIGGPKLAWKSNSVGMGYSTVSVQGDQVFALGKRGGSNVLICLGTRDGIEKWATVVSPGAEKDEYNTGWGDGPRSTPTIDGDRVYALCDLGTLGCFRRIDGSKIWSVHLVRDFGGEVPQWGYSESILIDEDRLIVTPGGKHLLIGLDKWTGKQVWKSEFSDAAQYVSVIKHVFNQIPMFITASKKGLVGIHATSGDTLFTHKATGNDVAVIPTPIVHNDLVYHTSGYLAGNSAVKLSYQSGKLVSNEVYHERKESMENHHGGVVLHDGVLFGFSRTLRGVWMAQELASGKVLWTKKVGRGTSGSIASGDGLLYCYDDQDGICYLVKPNRNKWEELGSVRLLETTDFDRKRGAIWTHPVIADGKLFIRDQEKLFVYNISRID